MIKISASGISFCNSIAFSSAFKEDLDPSTAASIRLNITVSGYRRHTGVLSISQVSQEQGDLWEGDDQAGRRDQHDDKGRCAPDHLKIRTFKDRDSGEYVTTEGWRG